MISHLFTTSFEIRRQVYTANKSVLTATGISFNGHIQQLAPEKVAQIAGSFKISHTIWCSVAETVQVGDILINGSNKYTVRSIQTNNYGYNKHLQLYVEQ